MSSGIKDRFLDGRRIGLWYLRGIFEDRSIHDRGASYLPTPQMVNMAIRGGNTVIGLCFMRGQAYSNRNGNGNGKRRWKTEISGGMHGK